MKNLKSIFEYSNLDEITNICNDILTDLKDDYPNITFANVSNEIFYILEIYPNYNYNKSRHEIEFIESKLNFINDFLKYAKTIKQSINKNIRIDDVFGERITIYFEK